MLHNRFLILWMFTLIVLAAVMPLTANAASGGSGNMSKAKANIDQALEIAKTDLVSSKQAYDQFHDQWLEIEDTVKSDSKLAYRDIETQMGQAEYAFMVNKQQDVITALQSLQQVFDKFIQGQYAKGPDVKGKDATLSDFIALLQQSKENVLKHDQATSLEAISKVRETWLSVEGTVVAQSASIYSDAERDIVVVNAMISDQKYDSASKLLDTMIAYLTPLAQKSSYTYWDAAMIPIREGLEALLVVGALLAFVKKSKDGKGKTWIWSGVLSGLLLSVILAIIIKFVFSSGAFGKNNFLISGWTGIFAAVMLLYMSYWLHSNSNIEQWNRYIQSKTQTALSTGRVISLGVLSFLAVFREGTETVLFIIGMINQISTQQLLLGILVGFGILAVIAYLMLFLGVKLPIRPFFLVSSLIVFYLCVKFMGLGVHGLQLAGSLPVSNASILPSIDFLGFYPSWQSAIPQLAIAIIAVAFLIGRWIRKRKTKSSIVTL
jgi:high-affinity iron transporter